MKKFFTLFAAVLFAGTMMAADLLSIDFTQGQGDWTIENVSNPDNLEFIWKQDATYGMKASSYVSGANHECESWLISPAIDLSEVTALSLTFSHARKYGELDQLKVVASSDGENWADLVVSAWPDGSSWSFIDASADLSSFAGQAAVKVAFVYSSSATSGATWEVKTAKLVEGEVVGPDVTFLPADFADQGASGTGGDVTATKDGVTISTNKGFGHSSALRIYKGGSFSVASAEQQIGKIVFTFGSYDGTPKDGGLDAEIIVNAMSFDVEALESAAYMQKIEIFFGEYEKPEPVDPDTITVAQAIEVGKALASGGVSQNEYVITGYVSNIVKPYSEQYGDETFWITDEKGNRASSTAQGAFEIYQCKPNTGAEIGYDAKIRILCKIKNYNGTIENNGKGIEFEVLEQGHELVRDTITVAKALELGAALEDNAVTNDEYVISGYVSSIETYYSEQYGNETFWIADEKGSRAASNADGAFYVFRGKLTPAEEMWTDAKVNVICRIKKYVKEGASPVIENEKANDAVEVIEKGEEEKVDTITVAQALEIGLALADQGVSDKRYAIEGFVSCIEEPFSETFGNETFWISDDKGVRAGSTTAGAFEVYRGKPDSGKELGFDAKIRIVCKIKNFHSTIENDGMNLAFEVLEQGEELHIDTLTVEKAIEKGMALPDGDKTDSLFVVSGYAVKAYDPDSTKSTLTQTWWMADDPDTKGDFEAYACTPDFLVQDNDYMLVLGRIQKYVSSKGTVTIELKGSAVHGEAPKVDTLTVAQALELGAALPDNTKTDERYAVIGYVASIDIEFAEDIQSFSLSDDNAAEVGAFKALNAFIDEPGAKLHDRVRLVGRIEKLVIGDASMIRIEGGKAKVIPGEGIETITVDGHTAQKIMVDGVIYIVRDNKIFNLQGERVR